MRLWPNRATTTSWREAWSTLAGTGQPPLRTAAAVGLGLAIGFLPVMPFQTLLALAFAFAFRLNRVTVFLGTLIWQPFTAPFILAAEYGLGRWIIAAPASAPSGSLWQRWGWPLAVGAPLVAAAGGAAGAMLAYLILRRRSRQNASPSVMQEGGE